jgi:hypothetical protein
MGLLMQLLTRYRSKTVAAWLALLLGSLGAHRLYLHGARDRRAWLYPLPTLVGLAGVLRMRNLGQDDILSALLIPLVGVTLSIAMLAAIVIALTPDEKWDARYNPGLAVHATGWAPVLAAMAGLFVGAAVLLSTIAFGGQRFFEWQAETASAAAAGPAQKSQPLTQ